MQNQNQKHLQTKPASMYDPKEWERILMQYQGVFKNNAKEYVKTLKFRKMCKTNYSR